MTVDLLTGAQDAAIALLREQLPPDQRGMARHTLLEGAQPPWHLIGDVDTENQGSELEQIEKISLDVQTVYRGRDRSALLALMHQVRLATDKARLTLDGGQYRFRWLGSAASQAASDGVTFAGVTTLEIMAEPA